MPSVVLDDAGSGGLFGSFGCDGEEDGEGDDRLNSPVVDGSDMNRQGMCMTNISVIDVGAWDRGPSERARLVEETDRACAQSGFFQIVGHGIDPELIGELLRAAEEFYARPVSEKLDSVTPPNINRGYSPIGAEALSYSLGRESPPDLFEAFNFAREGALAPVGSSTPEVDRIFAPNIWPATVPSLKPAATAYFDAVADLSLRLARIFAVALGVNEEFFVQRCTHPTELMRVIRYERHEDAPPPAEGQLRMGAHTDFGIVTVLYADAVPGLQILGQDGSWVSVVPEPGAFIINLGDLLAQWTNDRWRSTVHRVVPPPSDSTGRALRRSVAFFQDGDFDALVECLLSCASDANPPKYPPVLAGDHLLAKLSGSRELQRPDTVDTVGSRLAD